MKLNPLPPLVFALAVTLPGWGLAFSNNAAPTPERNPARTEAPVEAPAEAPAEASAETEAKPPPRPVTGWSEETVAAAKAECDKALANIELDYEPLPPIRRSVCGAPAPILVRSIGSNPKVTISPPATMTCRLAVALDAWLKNRVQPEAKLLFGSPVVKLRNAADYDCRNRYGNPKAPLSEHARANALDISEFKLESGERVTVLTSWPRVTIDQPDGPPPLPEPNPLRVAATTPAVLLVAERPKTTLQAVSQVRVVGNITDVTKVNPFIVATPLPPPIIPASLSATMPLTTIRHKVAMPPGISPPSVVPSLLRPERERQYLFIRKVFAHACKAFGTTLGPNANAAHSNHFHFDMKYRRGGYCQ